MKKILALVLETLGATEAAGKTLDTSFWFNWFDRVPDAQKVFSIWNKPAYMDSKGYQVVKI